MYRTIVIIILAFLLCIILCTFFKRRALKRVSSMLPIEKQAQLNRLLSPFGYCYDSSQDIISSKNDAWQRTYGYTAFFDKAAPHFNMVFDALPVYFNYQNRTWLIEFWKGQYGINTGAEIGLYYTDAIVPEKERSARLFQAVDDIDMFPMQLELLRNNSTLAVISKKTWWLTAFCMGTFSRPKDLLLKLTLTFPNCEMQRSFLTALLESGMEEKYIKVSGHRTSILFGPSHLPSYSRFSQLLRGFSQFFNHIFCYLFMLLTKPFSLTMDKLLYLYYLLPFVRSKILSPRKCKRCYSKHRYSNNQL